MFEPGNRRIWVPLANIPDFVQKAFVAAEDRRFFQHHGVDERGIIRAFIGNLADPGRPQGGSTITQQVVKNLLVGDDVTYERKIREMIVASRRREHAEQIGNPRALSQLRLSRPRRLGRRDGRAQLFRQVGEGPHACRRRDAGRPAQRAELLQSRPPSRSRQGAARLRARPHAGRRRDHRRAEGPRACRAAQARGLRAAAARQRLSLHRFSRPRGEGRRCREPDRRTLHGPLDHRRGLAARHRSGAAGRAWRVTRSLQRPHAVPRARGQYRRRRAEAQRRRGATAATTGDLPAWQQALQACACRSTTCIGSRPSFSTRAASAATARSASGSATAASCR